MSERRSNCPVTFALDSYGDKWSLLILRDVLFLGKRTYREFAESDEKIATNILANRLEKLERNGFLKKTRNPENKRTNFYNPTLKTMDLIPMLLEIVQWSAKYDDQTAVPKDFIRKLKRDRFGVIQDIKEKIKQGERIAPPPASPGKKTGRKG